MVDALLAVRADHEANPHAPLASPTGDASASPVPETTVA